MSHIGREPCSDGVMLGAHGESPCPKSARSWVLAASILGSSLAFIDGTVVNVALPAIQADLDATIGDAQWVVESYALLLAALLLVGGSLGDRYGRRRVFAVGVVGFAVTSLLCGLAPSVEVLIAARALKGAAAALLVPGSLALIAASYDRASRGKAIGTWSAMTGVTSAIGPVLGGWLVQTLSWRWAFFVNLPVAAIVLALLWRVPESRDDDATGRLDWTGAALAAVGLGALVFGMVALQTTPIADPLVWGSLVVGAAAIVAFLVVEARVDSPMLPLELFRSRDFAGANLLTLLLYTALGGTFFFLPFDLIQIHGYTESQAGAALLPFVVVMSVLSRWSGGLVDRYGPTLPLVVGPLVAAGGFALLARPTTGGSYWTTFAPAIVVLGLGMAISIAPLTTVVMTALDERRAGMASGVNNAVSRVAGLVAIAALGVVISASFDRSLDARLDELGVPAPARAALDREREKLAGAAVPPDVGEPLRAELSRAVEDAFVVGFQRAMYVSAGLAAAGALAAAALIGRNRRREQNQTPSTSSAS